MKTTIKFLFVALLSAATLIIGCDRAAQKESVLVEEKDGRTDQQSGNLGLLDNRNSDGFGFESKEGTVSAYMYDSNVSANGLTSSWGTSNNSSERGFMSSSAAVEDGKDTTRKFIRTAEMRFRVKNVLQATYSIEDIAKQFDGFVTYTNLSSNIDKKTITPVSADSSLESIYYTVVNNITLRVPNTKLDTTLKTISNHIDYLDYRTIKAEDVALQMLNNRLAQDRATKSGKRIEGAIDEQGKKLRETTGAEELLDRKQEQADAARIATLSLLDRINYSTITLNIYERQAIKRELISNEKNIDAYKPGFGTQISNALKWGWGLLEAIFVFIARIWGLILIGVAAYIVYKIVQRKRKS